MLGSNPGLDLFKNVLSGRYENPSKVGCGDWICSRTYQVGAEKSRLKLVVGARNRLDLQLRLLMTVTIASSRNPVQGMSVFEVKADLSDLSLNVRFVPEADVFAHQST